VILRNFDKFRSDTGPNLFGSFLAPEPNPNGHEYQYPDPIPNIVGSGPHSATLLAFLDRDPLVSFYQKRQDSDTVFSF